MDGFIHCGIVLFDRCIHFIHTITSIGPIDVFVRMDSPQDARFCRGVLKPFVGRFDVKFLHIIAFVFCECIVGGFVQGSGHLFPPAATVPLLLQVVNLDELSVFEES